MNAPGTRTENGTESRSEREALSVRGLKTLPGVPVRESDVDGDLLERMTDEAHGMRPDGPGVPEALSVQGVKIRRCVIIRESDVDRDLLEGLMDQTYRMCLHWPGVREALELGLTPYDDPDGVDGAVRIHAEGHRAVSFVRHGTLFVIWGGSAASENEAGENAFTSHLARMVLAFRPEDLFVSTFSRLTRSQNVQGRLRAALINAGTSIHCGSQVIDLATEYGRMMWDVLCLVYSMERDQIERRLVLGQVFAARRGAWLLSSAAVPPGYELEECDGRKHLRVTNDPEEIDRVRRMIAILASKGTARAKMDAIGALGVTRTRNVPGGTETYAANDASNPTNTIRTLNSYLDLYRRGETVFRRPVPRSFDRLEEVGGFPISRDDPDAQPMIRVPIPVGLPSGGWAPDAVFEAWEAEMGRASSSNSNPGGSGHSRVKPLSGTCLYVDAAREWKLMSDGHSCYVLRSRPVNPTRRHRGWDARKGESTVEAKFRAAELHRSIADAIREALRGGCEIQVTEAEVAVSDDGHAEVVFLDEGTKRAFLEDQIEKLLVQTEKYAELAATSESNLLAGEYHRQAEEVAKKIEGLHVRLSTASEGRPAPETMVVHGRTLFKALDTLSSIETTAPRKVAHAVRTVLNDLRWELHDEVARWTLDVHLPTTEGLAILRGVSGEIRRRSRARPYRADKIAKEVDRKLLDLVAEGAGATQVLAAIDRLGVQAGSMRLGLAMKAIDMPAATRRVVQTHPIPEVRQVLVRDHLGQQLPQSFSPGWVALVRQAFAAWEDIPVRPRWVTVAQPVVDHLGEHGGPLAPVDLARAIGMSRVDRLIARLGYRQVDGQLYRVDDSPRLVREQEGLLVGLTCSACSSARWEVVGLPEFYGLVCRSCHTSADGKRFPASYLAWKTTRPLGAAMRAAAVDPATKLKYMPTGVFTLRQWADAAGVAPGALQAFRDRLLADGRIKELEPDPGRSSPGMAPRRYRRTAQLQEGPPAADAEVHDAA